MVKIINQNIPSELLDAYKRSLRQSTDWKPGANIYTARTRQPFKLPHMRSNRGNSPSGSQLEVRAAFKSCIECYNNSPGTGGATPPDIGYRSREWWFNEAAGSGLWYYDYFISQTWAYFYAGEIPDWCKLPPTYIPVDVVQGSTQKKHGGESSVTAAAAWAAALSEYNGASWTSEGYEDRYIVEFRNESNYINPVLWGATIAAFRAKLTVDLTMYDPDDYYYAKLVMVLKNRFDVFYNGQGWVENEYNFLLDVTDALGTVWFGADYYNSDYTPSQPADRETKGYVVHNDLWGYQGFYIELSKKPEK